MRWFGPKGFTTPVCTLDLHPGGGTRHPMSPTWPLETLSVTRFDEQDGKTLITVDWSALDATPEEQKTFDESHESLRTGCSGTIAQIDAFLPEFKQTSA